MSRNIINTMESIINVLKKHISDDDIGRIVDARRHIQPFGDADPVCDFVKKAKIKHIKCNSEDLCLFDFNNEIYLLLSERHHNTLKKIGFELETDPAVIQGAGMLAIAYEYISLKENIDSLWIIEHCLGIEPETGSGGDIAIDFSTILDFFEKYCIIKRDDSRFELFYKEDYNRLMGYLLAEETTTITLESKNRVQELLLLHSSRSIAGSILNGIQSSLMEYSFLQFYQCLEYLFRLNNCFAISEKYDVDLKKSIDIVLEHEFKKSESENLYQVLKANIEETSLKPFKDFLCENSFEEGDAFKKIMNYVYKLRCNVAHLRYIQDDISDVDWRKCIAALIEIIFPIYQKRDSDIIQVCNIKNTWSKMEIS